MLSHVPSWFRQAAGVTPDVGALRPCCTDDERPGTKHAGAKVTTKKLYAEDGCRSGMCGDGRGHDATKECNRDTSRGEGEGGRTTRTCQIQHTIIAPLLAHAHPSHAPNVLRRGHRHRGQEWDARGDSGLYDMTPAAARRAPGRGGGGAKPSPANGTARDRVTVQLHGNA